MVVIEGGFKEWDLNAMIYQRLRLIKIDDSDLIGGSREIMRMERVESHTTTRRNDPGLK